MLVYAGTGGRSPAGFEALCLEPENEADCKAIDALLSAVKVMADLKFVGGNSADQPPQLKRKTGAE